MQEAFGRPQFSGLLWAGLYLQWASLSSLCYVTYGVREIITRFRKMRLTEGKQRRLPLSCRRRAVAKRSRQGVRPDRLRREHRLRLLPFSELCFPRRATGRSLSKRSSTTKWSLCRTCPRHRVPSSIQMSVQRKPSTTSTSALTCDHALIISSYV
ncbi:uncharacterized protein [Penaeus vannamei]|uniref:uncharacterized protein isoform X1 n=1 Tax=Penaeus vannamei TaxID=6689 RepID=UPI00387F6FBE